MSKNITGKNLRIEIKFLLYLTLINLNANKNDKYDGHDMNCKF